MGEYESAVSWAVRAQYVRSTDVRAWLIAGRAHARLGAWEKALQDADAILERHPTHRDAKRLRVKALLRMGRLSDAASAMRALGPRDTDEGFDELIAECAGRFVGVEAWEDALAAARKSNGTEMADIEVRSLRALARYDELFDAMTQKDGSLAPDDRAEIWFLLNVEAGVLPRALWWLKRVPDDRLDARSLVRLTEALLKVGKEVESAHSLSKLWAAIQRGPKRRADYFELLVAATRLSLASNVPSRALDFAGLLAEDFPDHPWSWVWFARALRSNGELVGAKAALEAALIQQEDLPAAWAEMALVQDELPDLDKERARTHRHLVESSLDRVSVLLPSLLTLSELEDADYVRAVLDRISTMFLENRDFLVARFHLLKAIGEDEAAASWLQQLRQRQDVSAKAALFRVDLDLDAYESATNRLDELTSGAVKAAEVVKLASWLRNRGHLTRASRVLNLVPEEEKGHRQYRRLAHSVQGELRALLGPAPRVSRVGHMVPEPRRVLHMVGKSVPHILSGYAIRTKYVVEAQRRVGIDARVLTEPNFPWSAGAAVAPLEELVDGVTYYRSRGRRPDPDDHIDRMADIVRQVRPSLLHAASDFKNAINALELGRRFGIPVVYEVRGIWEETWLSKLGDRSGDSEVYRLRKERETECMRAADHVVTLSETLRSELLRRGVPPEKITVIPNAVDTTRFEMQGRDPNLASALRIAPDEVTIGYISSLVAYEGIEYLLEAISNLHDRGFRVRGLLVGDGECRQGLEQYADHLGLADVVQFTGRVPHEEVLAYYGMIDIFVVPRTDDRVCHLVTPLKPYEAMATGRVIVVSDVEALREIVEDGRTGLTFRAESSADLAGKLALVIEDQALRTRLSSAAADQVRSRNTWPTIAHQYSSLYDSLAGS